MTTSKGFIEEFMEFLKNYQVIGLAVAVIIGAAAGKMVTAMVNDIIMPIIAVVVPGGVPGAGQPRGNERAGHLRRVVVDLLEVDHFGVHRLDHSPKLRLVARVEETVAEDVPVDRAQVGRLPAPQRER